MYEGTATRVSTKKSLSNTSTPLTLAGSLVLSGLKTNQFEYQIILLKAPAGVPQGYTDLSQVIQQNEKEPYWNKYRISS